VMIGASICGRPGYCRALFLFLQKLSLSHFLVIHLIIRIVPPYLPFLGLCFAFPLSFSFSHYPIMSRIAFMSSSIRIYAHYSSSTSSRSFHLVLLSFLLFLPWRFRYTSSWISTNINIFSYVHILKDTFGCFCKKKKKKKK
jgi:hypothetical protein